MEFQEQFGTEVTPRVLVVDDLEENTVLLRNFLRPKGYGVVCASNGREALDEVRKTPPDVILLDLMMPEVNGFEVCRQLKAQPQTQHIPIIIITGLPDRETNIRAVEAGADDFLQKPFDSVLLEARIRTSIRAKRMYDHIVYCRAELEVQNQYLEDRVFERTALLERTQHVTVFSLAKLAESRDTETGDHLERMRCYARLIALELLKTPTYAEALDPEFPEQIYRSSPLHDVGKVGIPDRILLKPGKLTPGEFEIMKTHTIVGGETLKAADEEAGRNSFLAMGRDIAYSHHEKWDGTGYPYGMGGEEIPLASRVVAVSDVYDALSSKRPYKEPFSHETSMQMVIEGRGSAFDPEVLDAFVRCEPDVVRVRKMFQSADVFSPLHKLTQQIEALRAQSL